MPLDPDAGEGGALALDLSREVGVAYGLLEDLRPSFATWRLWRDEELPFMGKKPEADYEGLRFLRFEDRLLKALNLYRPRYVVIEMGLKLPALAEHSSEAIANQQRGLRAIAVTCATRFSCAKSEIEPKIVRRDVAGMPWNTKRDPAKYEAKLWCRRRDMKVENDNEADAILLWVWHKHQVTGVPPCAGALWREAR